ncbi:MAG: outer membrane lipid asymmetry maintenance protein MlaD [Pseudomonadota bacterium]
MRTVEISVGAFVLAGLVALTFLAVRVSGVNVGGGDTGYSLLARFNDVSGLRERAKVTMAGVTIGRVASISVDAEYGEAIVTLTVSSGVGPLALDTGAQVVTEGVMGGRYIALSPGADEEYLQDGDEITETQGALVLENLIGDLVTSLGN